MINPKLWKLISPFHTFQYPKGHVDIISLRIVRFQNFNHHYKWENVYLNNISRTQFWPCAHKSLILTEWVAFFSMSQFFWIWHCKLFVLDYCRLGVEIGHNYHRFNFTAVLWESIVSLFSVLLFWIHPIYGHQEEDWWLQATLYCSPVIIGNFCVKLLLWIYTCSLTYTAE